YRSDRDGHARAQRPRPRAARQRDREGRAQGPVPGADRPPPRARVRAPLKTKRAHGPQPVGFPPSPLRNHFALGLAGVSRSSSFRRAFALSWALSSLICSGVTGLAGRAACIAGGGGPSFLVPHGVGSVTQPPAHTVKSSRQSVGLIANPPSRRPPCP